MDRYYCCLQLRGHIQYDRIFSSRWSVVANVFVYNERFWMSSRFAGRYLRKCMADLKERKKLRFVSITIG
jgi:hypothetical protein